MKSPCLAVLSFLALTGFASGLIGGQCPLCSSHEVKYCNIDINPEVRLYNHEVDINITEIFRETATPKDKTDVEIWFYNSSAEIEKLKFRTDRTGIIRFVPKIVGYHIVKTCDKAVLFYANTTCGDGVCADIENRRTCTADCGKCGDGVCDLNENLTACPKDCATCGDRICSPGETRSNCLKDCAMCGDDICDYVENRASCPIDCRSGKIDGYCDGEADGICDPDCAADKDSDCAPKVNPTVIDEATAEDEEADPRPILAGIIVILGAGALAYFILTLRKGGFRKHHKKKKKERTEERKKSP